MEEYSRIIIEEYCINHPKTKKAEFLWEMVHLSYDVACEPETWQLMQCRNCYREKKCRTAAST